MLCEICTMVQKSIVTAATAEKRHRLETNYAAHLKKDHRATQAEIEARLYATNPAVVDHVADGGKMIREGR